MSRKHYREVAEILNRGKNKDHWSFETDVDDIFIMFKRDNPRFDTSKFKEACGI